MVLDLEALDWMDEIVPDGGSGINEGIQRVLEGFGIRLTTMVEERLHPRRN